MSEVGIEQDALMHASLINPMEDDLITYESDVEGQSRDLQGAKPSASMPDTKQNYGADSGSQDGNEQAANTTDDFTFEKTEEYFEDNETNGQDVDQHDLNSNDLDTYAEIEIEEHTDKYIEDEDPSNSHQPTDKEDDDYMQELDYVHDDTTGELPNDGIDHTDSGVYDQVQDEENGEDSTEDAKQGPVSSDSAGEVKPDPSAPTEEDEITWDEAEPENQHDASPEAAHGMSPDASQPGASELSGKDAVGEGAEAQNGVEEEVAEETYENEDVHEIDYDEEPTLTELQGDEADLEGQVDEHDSRQVSVKEEESSRPTITVQYRGDEFPFFSDTSDGFFSELSVLDDSMESLLAGFRSELANEIPPEEELVFQIDELGLEFAESQTQDTVSGITLRQILEVFDLLVKNQDPDSSRVLYTYLFTRPTTSKRFDFLVESATAGKGLDEVIHLFGSPMPQGTANLIADSQAADDYHESLDNYESGAEEHHSTEEQTEASGGEDDQDHVHLQDEDLEVLEEGAAEGEQNVEGSMVFSHETVQADVEAVPEATQETEDASVTKLDRSFVEGVETAGDSDHYMLHESDHIEVSQPAEAGLDLENQGDASFAEPDMTYGMESTSTHDTGTTGTMLDDDAHVDLTAQTEPPVTTPTAHGDDMDEIDWREEPEVDVVGVAEADVESDTPNASVKRSRTEDEEVDLDEDKDVKRRRS